MMNETAVALGTIGEVQPEELVESIASAPAGDRVLEYGDAQDGVKRREGTAATSRDGKMRAPEYSDAKERDLGL